MCADEPEENAEESEAYADKSEENADESEACADETECRADEPLAPSDDPEERKVGRIPQDSRSRLLRLAHWPDAEIAEL